MKPEKTRVKLTPEKIRRCRATAKANRSTFEQELFLAAGGDLRDWYESGNECPVMFGMNAGLNDNDIAEFTDKEVARSLSFKSCAPFRERPAKADPAMLEAEARAISFRMTVALMRELGRSLKQKELLAICTAAIYIGREPSESARIALEAHAISRAIWLSHNAE